MHKQVASVTLGGATMDGEGWSASPGEVGDEDGEIAPARLLGTRARGRGCGCGLCILAVVVLGCVCAESSVVVRSPRVVLSWVEIWVLWVQLGRSTDPDP